MKFYTWCDKANDERLEELLKSADMNNIQLQILGIGEKKWKNFDKIDYLYSELKKLPDHEIVCAVDGFDVFFQVGEKEILKQFSDLNVDLVFAGERGYIFQLEECRSFYDSVDTESPYKYVNGGTIIGSVFALKSLFSLSLKNRFRVWASKRQWLYDALKHAEYLFWKVQRKFGLNKALQKLKNRELKKRFSWIDYNDQTHYSYFMATDKKVKKALDYETKLFWCAAEEWDNLESHYSVNETGLINKHTGNVPCIIHVPFTQKHRKKFTDLFDQYSKMNNQ